MKQQANMSSLSYLMHQVLRCLQRSVSHHLLRLPFSLPCPSLFHLLPMHSPSPQFMLKDDEQMQVKPSNGRASSSISIRSRMDPFRGEDSSTLPMKTSAKSRLRSWAKLLDVGISKTRTIASFIVKWYLIEQQDSISSSFSSKTLDFLAHDHLGFYFSILCFPTSQSGRLATKISQLQQQYYYYEMVYVNIQWNLDT